MTTLHQYLEDIAAAVLDPIGRYKRPGKHNGTVVTYCGLHSNPDSINWEEGWELMATVTPPLDLVPGVYKLYWTSEDNDLQASWWVKL
jgi:hypothetical protein